MPGALIRRTKTGSSSAIVRRRRQHRRQHRLHLAHPRAGEQGEVEGLAGEVAAGGGAVPDVGQLGHLVHQRVADPGHLGPVTAVEVDLEGEEHHHQVDHLGDGANPPAPPGPDLRTDVVEHRHPPPLQLTGEAQVELREIDQHRHRRAATVHRRQQLGEHLAGAGQDLERLGEADHGDLGAVGEGIQTGRPQLVAAEAESLDVGEPARSSPSRRAPCRSPDASPATTSRRGLGAAAVMGSAPAARAGTGTSATPPPARRPPCRRNSCSPSLTCSRRSRRQSTAKKTLTSAA